jgi:hypothetical protein
VEIHWENAKRGETQREIYEKWLEIVKKIDKWLEWDFETIFCESFRAKSGLKLVKFAGENLPKGMQSLQNGFLNLAKTPDMSDAHLSELRKKLWEHRINYPKGTAKLPVSIELLGTPISNPLTWSYF